MREITKQVYTFGELSPEAQAKAIEEYIEGIDWGIESEFIGECFKEDLKALGLPYENVEWSLNYCQGDGVAFYGGIYEYDSITKLAKTLLSEVDSDFLIEMLDEIKLSFDIVRNGYGHRYSHWNTMEVEMELSEWSDRLDFDGGSDLEEYDEVLSERVLSVCNDLLEGLKDYVKEVSRKLEKQGYEMIDGIQSEETARQYFMEEDDGEFYENGKRFVG